MPNSHPKVRWVQIREPIRAADGTALPPDNRGIRIVKDIVLIGDEHEGVGRGSTGEFYDFIIVDDTQRVVVSSELTTSAVETGLERSDYRARRRVTLLSLDKVPASSHLRVRYQLRERDKGGDVQKVVAASKNLGKFVGQQVGGALGGPAGGVVGGTVVSGGLQVVSDLLKANDDDEVVVDDFALDRFTNWGIGRYIRLSSNHSPDSRAIFSVRALGVAGTGGAGVVHTGARKVALGGGSTVIDIPTPKGRAGMLSILWTPAVSLGPTFLRKLSRGVIQVSSQAGKSAPWRPSDWQPSYVNAIPVEGSIRIKVKADESMVGELSFIWTHESQFDNPGA